MATCAAPQCDRETRSGRAVLCDTHYQRQIHGIDISTPIATRTPHRGCSIDGCERPHGSKGLCRMHYESERRKTNPVPPKRKPGGEESVLAAEVRKERDERIVLLAKAGWSDSQIAGEVGLSPGRVRKIRVYAGVSSNHTQGGGNAHRNKRIAGLAAAGWNDTQIGAELEMNAPAVLATRRRHGIPSGWKASGATRTIAVSEYGAIDQLPERGFVAEPLGKHYFPEAFLTVDEGAKARCVDDTEPFFSTDAAPALAICAECPIRQRCLEVALANGEIGVWGGTTTEERKELAIVRAVEIAA